MNGQYKSPLSESHCNALDEALKSIMQTAETIRRCKACGLPVEQAEAENERQRQLAESLKRQFFPERP